MKWNRPTVVVFLFHAIISLMFIVGIAGFEMRAAYTVRATVLKVLPYVFSLGLSDLLVLLLSLLALTGLLVVQAFFLKARMPFNIMGVSMVLFLGIAASLLNSNSMQGAFSFIPDGLETTCRMLAGTLTENMWSADTWVLQASMMWWLLLWAGLIVSRNIRWMITKDSTVPSEGAPSDVQ